MQILSCVFFFSLNAENTGYAFAFYSNFLFQFGAGLTYAQCRQAPSKHFLLLPMTSPWGEPTG